MKILVLLALLLALCYNSTQDCPQKSRMQIRFKSGQKNISMTCDTEPKKTLVPLEVPEGYDYVKPTMVRIPQCSGLPSCSYEKKCLPTSTNMRTFIVEAFKTGYDHEPHCEEVFITEHQECACACPTDCPENTVLDDTTCECKCAKASFNKCSRMLQDGHSVQWSRKECKCKCIRPSTCDDTMEWDKKTCHCNDKPSAKRNKV